MLNSDFAIKNDTLVTYIGDDTEVKIPNNVRLIGKGAFKGCRTITSVTIPDGVVEIGSNAFCECKSLVSVNIPESVTKISSSAFKGCESLTNITIPNTVKTIGRSAFKGCQKLTDVVLSKGLKIISESLFQGCRGLVNITIPDSVTEIGDSAFEWCFSLSNIKLPNGITKIGANAFLRCASLENIDIPKSVIEIGRRAFGSCKFKEITIPGNIKEISCYIFEGCENLTSITILEGVECISQSVFSGCKKLKNIILPKSLAFIDYRAFAKSMRPAARYHYDIIKACENLLCVTLPNHAVEIGFSNAYGHEELRFAGCEKLNDVEGLTMIRSTVYTSIIGASEDSMAQGIKNMNTLGANVFTIYAPSGSLAAQYAAENNITYIETPKDKYIKIFCSKDYVEKIESFVNKYKIPKDFFGEVFLKPAKEANATKCIEFLTKWKAENL